MQLTFANLFLCHAVENVQLVSNYSFLLGLNLIQFLISHHLSTHHFSNILAMAQKTAWLNTHKPTTLFRDDIGSLRKVLLTNAVQIVFDLKLHSDATCIF